MELPNSDAEYLVQAFAFPNLLRVAALYNTALIQNRQLVRRFQRQGKIVQDHDHRFAHVGQQPGGLHDLELIGNIQKD